jgi:tetratricopeptide (TPR) repeat protein
MPQLEACANLPAGEDPQAHFLFGRARAARGDNRAAIAALRRCLELDAGHAGAYSALGALLAKIGLGQLAIPFLEMAVALRPDDPATHTDLGNVLLAQGAPARALACFRSACALRPLVTWPAARQPARFSALLIQAPGAANTPPEFLFAHASYDCHFFAVMPGSEPDIGLLRRHGDIIVNLICDADQGGEALTATADIIERLGRPTINHPHRIHGTNRDAAAKLLADIPRCRVPRAMRTTRERLVAADTPAGLEQDGFALPLLLRVAGTHGGEAFEKIENRDDLAKFLRAHDGPDFYVTEYLDYASADGLFRKYRFVFTDQDILPYHLAIGHGWKVHHYTTAMDRHAWMQDEEKAFLADPGAVFSPAHHDALAAIRAAIGLEFFGIDCALDRDGDIVVFEVNASILIHDDNADFPYKTPYCARIKDALDRMVTRLATGASGSASSTDTAAPQSSRRP